MRPFTLLLILLASAPALAQLPPRIILGPSDNIAIDQPRVAVGLEDPVTGHFLGPDFANSWLLDTGANGMLAGETAVDEMMYEGYRTEGTFTEQGIGLPVELDVSAVYDVYYAGSDNAALAIPGSRILSHPEADYGGFGGVMGMPAMIGRTVSLDLAGMIAPDSELGFEYINVAFGSSVPASAGHRYQVPLSLQSWPTGTGVVPTYAPIPFVQVQARNGTHRVNSGFVVDTGAQLSGISTQMALDLGLDTDGDGDLYDETDTFVPITGVSGTVELPVLQVPRLAVMTSQGVELVWTDLEVIVADVDESIGGIFGMDLLASGWAEPVLEQIIYGSTDKTGYAQRVHFDFRNSQSASLTLDLSAPYDQLLHGGDANGDGIVNIGDLGILAGHWGQTGMTWLEGDFNDDQAVNIGDFGVMAGAWGQTFGGSALPEPSAALVLAAGWFAGLLRRRAR